MKKLWFVCQTKSRKEERARYFLERKGFEVYLPMMEAQRVIGHKTTLMPKPLFPNYLFVRFNQEEDVPLVQWTQGVRKILPESIHPGAIDDQVVESLRSLAQRDGIIRKQPLKKFDTVRILRGPLKEIMGIFEEWSSDKGRIRILLSFVNYQARVELHHSYVEKVA